MRDLVEDSDVPRREVEARLGWNRGYLAQLLGGFIELKLWHVLAVLEAIGQPPAPFFDEIFPPPKKARRQSPEGLRVNADVLKVYVSAVESISELRRRLERCERAIGHLARGGLGELIRRQDDPGT